uniref:Cation-transporting P-type ATPase N-terminal domain-containing protein n=1 Tax=Parascaris univalens TaxID=6257 RepID=A0A915CEA2_PARUN
MDPQSGRTESYRAATLSRADYNDRPAKPNDQLPTKQPDAQVENVPQQDSAPIAKRTKAAGKKGRRTELTELKQEMKMDEHVVPIEQLVARLQTNLEKVPVLTMFGSQYHADSTDCRGLTDAQAAAAIARDGPNALSPPKKVPEWVKFCKNLFGGFAMLLWIGAFLCFVAYAVDAFPMEYPSKDNMALYETSRAMTTAWVARLNNVTSA